METQKIIVLILLSALHLVLAGMLLYDLSKRKKVLGHRKAPWAILIILVTFIGSLLYLLCHPSTFIKHEED